MRVLMISKACVQGIYQRKLEEMAQHGLELTVAVPPGWRDERGWVPLERRYTAGYRLQVTPIGLNGSFHLHYYPRLKQLIDGIRPALVHIDEEPYNLAAWQAMRLARRVGARTLFFTWQNRVRRYPPPFSWFERYAYRRASYAIAGNRDAARVLRVKGYEGPLSVIPQFGVDPALYSRVQPPFETCVIGYVGRLVPEKGITDLLRAAAGLEGEWVVRLLGSGPERERLSDMANQLGIAERTFFDEQIPSLEVPSYLAQLHVLVLPSHTRPNWQEQFGRVLPEAMVSGVPVVGSDSGEIPNVIGDAGLIYPEGNVEALRAHLQALIGDRTLWGELAERGRERVLAHYTQAQVAAETVAVYRRLIRGP